MATVAIDIEQDIHPVTDLEADATAILEHVRNTGRPVILTEQGRGTAVVIDIRVYQALVEENATLRDVLAGLEDEREGDVLDHEDALQEVRAAVRRGR